MAYDFLNIAYQYFPRGIDSMEQSELYYKSDEIKLLFKVFNENFEKQQNGDFDSFYDALQHIAPEMDLHTHGLYTPNERAHNIHLTQLVETTLYSICLNISIIAPFYTMYVLETDVDRFLKKPVDFSNTTPLNTFRNKEKEIEYLLILEKIAAITEKTFSISRFPEELLDVIIPDINHEMTEMGHFTLFNAFFLDKYTIRI